MTDLMAAPWCPTCQSPAPRLRADTAPGVPCPDRWHTLPPAAHTVVWTEGCRCVLTDDGLRHEGCPQHNGLPMMPPHLGGMMLARALAAVDPHSPALPELLATAGAWMAYLAGTVHMLERHRAEVAGNVLGGPGPNKAAAEMLSSAAAVLRDRAREAQWGLDAANAKAGGGEAGTWSEWLNNWLGGPVGEYCAAMSPAITFGVANMLEVLSWYTSAADPIDLQAATDLSRLILATSNDEVEWR